jgi:predicted RNase H-related nuclease YkuK (DUF458 family)
MEFNILNSKKIVDVESYVRDYFENYPDAQIMIGCDSQNNCDETIYGIVLVLYREGKGGHVLYDRKRVPRIKDRWLRLWKEVELSIELANHLVDQGLPKARWIDVDLNPDPKYKSNDVIRAAVGLVESMGYSVRVKPYSIAASYAADKICK